MRRRIVITGAGHTQFGHVPAPEEGRAGLLAIQIHRIGTLFLPGKLNCSGVLRDIGVIDCQICPNRDVLVCLNSV